MSFFSNNLRDALQNKLFMNAHDVQSHDRVGLLVLLSHLETSIVPTMTLTVSIKIRKRTCIQIDAKEELRTHWAFVPASLSLNFF